MVLYFYFLFSITDKIKCENSCIKHVKILHFCRVYCLIGDGESAEGSIWEALHFASYYGLDNLCVIFDVNRLGQSEPTSLQHNMDVYRKRLDAFGCNAIVVDGHSVEELCKVLSVHSYLNDTSVALYLDFLPFLIELQDIRCYCRKSIHVRMVHCPSPHCSLLCFS